MIPKTAEYALRAVACLALQQEETLRADTLAQRTQIPRRYLHKVLQDLASAGLVESRSGPGGGYTLHQDPRHITILNVINAVGEFERIRHCPLELPSHTRLCPLHQELDKVYAAAEQAFAKVTIADVLKSTENGIDKYAAAIIPLCDVSRVE